MFYKVKEVKALPHLKLLVRFIGGVIKKVRLLEHDPNVQFVIDSQIQRIDEHNNLFGSVCKMDIDKIQYPTAKDTLFLDFNKIHSGCYLWI